MAIAGMAKLADALDLGSSSYECRFDSCYPHHLFDYLNLYKTSFLFYIITHTIKKDATMDKKWNELYEAALDVLNPHVITEWMEAGGVAAAIESVSGKIYVGVCIDGACTLGICAERNAIFNMITNGENSIKKVIAVNWDKKVLPPCGSCRELMTQLMPHDYHKIEIMLDYEKEIITTLDKLTPNWWI